MPVYQVEEYQVIPPGLYEALMKEIVEKQAFFTNEEGEEERRRYYQWVFEVVNDDEFGGRRLFANVSDKFGPRSKARQWTESMTGRTFRAGEKFDTDELLGEIYHLTVTNVEKNGKTYAEVTSINKIRKRKAKDMGPATEQEPGADKKMPTEAAV